MISCNNRDTWQTSYRRHAQARPKRCDRFRPPGTAHLANLRAKRNLAPWSGRHELENPETFVVWEVSGEPPPYFDVKLLRPSTSATGMITASNFMSTLSMPTSPIASPSKMRAELPFRLLPGPDSGHVRLLRWSIVGFVVPGGVRSIHCIADNSTVNQNPIKTESR